MASKETGTGTNDELSNVYLCDGNLSERQREHSLSNFNFRNKSESQSSSQYSHSSTDDSDRVDFSFGRDSSTSRFDITFLKSLGIHYCNEFFGSPLDLLDMVYEKTGLFNCLTDEQKEDAKCLQDSMTYSFSVIDLMQINMDQDDMSDVDDIIIEEMRNDITNIRDSVTNPRKSRGIFYSVLEDFIRSTVIMVQQQQSFITQYYGSKLHAPVPKAMFAEIFKQFVKICGLLPMPGAFYRAKMCIQHVPITSKPDIVICTSDQLFSTCYDTISVVSIVEIKNLMALKPTEAKKEKKTKPLTSTPSDSTEVLDKECTVYHEPAIFTKLSGNVLAQHGGELLLNHECGKCELRKRPMLKYIPGMIVVGTQVYLTVLVLDSRHLGKLEKEDCNEKTEYRSYIYYSEPKDLLIKKDRDVLLQAFIRLNNVK